MVSVRQQQQPTPAHFFNTVNDGNLDKARFTFSASIFRRTTNQPGKLSHFSNVP